MRFESSRSPGILKARSGQPPGFRMDRVDVIFLIFLVTLSATITATIGEPAFALIPVYLGFTFFLFCNVFRIGNKLEPLWYLPFTGAAGWCLHTLNIDLFWWLVVIFLEPWKWTLIAYRIIKGPYLGIFSKASRINNR